MSFIGPRETLLRDDPALPAELRRAFASYGSVSPSASSSAEMLASLQRRASADLGRQRTRRALQVVSLVVLNALLIAGVWRSSDRAPTAPQAGTSPGVEAPVVMIEEPAGEAPDVTPAPPMQAEVVREKVKPARKVRVQQVPHPAPVPSLADELALLARAKRTLARDPEQALSLATEHERAFAHGKFVEEREVIAIEALMRSGARELAMERAATFRAAYPRSTHLDRLRVILQEP
jgi:hypothetical protein